MSARSIQFIIFLCFSLASLLAGYFGRRRGIVAEEASRPLHFFTVVVTWSVVGFLGVWRIPPDAANLWVVAIEPFLVVIPALLMIPLARLLGASDNHTGVLAIGAGLSNLGFTLGGYLCYTLLTDPTLLPGGDTEPSEVGRAALAYSIAQVSMMSVSGIAVLYPLARHFSPATQGSETVGRLVYHSLVDWRAMMLYAAVLGAVLAYARVPYPTVLDDLHVLDVLFYLGAFTAYFGIGLRLHLGPLGQYVREHSLLAGMKFLGLPLLTAALLVLANLLSAGPPVLAERVTLVLSPMPTAIQTVIVPNLFHLDARFASGLWLVNTVLFAVLPLPVLVFLLT
jgi:predicted permease